MLRSIFFGILLGAAIYFVPFGLLFLLFLFLCWRFFVRPWRSSYWRYHGLDQTGTIPIDGRYHYKSYDRNASGVTIPVQ